MSHSPDQTPFYVGYLPAAPSTRLFVVVVAGLIFGLLAADAYVLATAQPRAGDGEWADAAQVTLSGIIVHEPYPILRITDAGGAPADVLLVGEGKHAAPTTLLDGPATLIGTQIERGGLKMFEVAGTVAPGAASPPALEAPAVEAFGAATLKGQIVDSKCWLGVMRPGEGPVHKGCATLCILGGIPPMLMTRDANGGTRAYLLTGPNGEAANEAVAAFIADPIEISGTIEQRGSFAYFKADFASLKRL
ncbi:MAG: hypothetical protein GC199_00770 [Alphaproteobacteria bacterium]|nr:hypothetical protein [Alphaproteobacteria bacterium]